MGASPTPTPGGRAKIEDQTDAGRRRPPRDDKRPDAHARRQEAEESARRQPQPRTGQKAGVFGVNDWLTFLEGQFADPEAKRENPVKVLWGMRQAVDPITTTNNRRQQPVTMAALFEEVMNAIGDKTGEKAEKVLGSYYGMQNGNRADVAAFFAGIRTGMPNWKKCLLAPSQKLGEKELALINELAESGQDLVLPDDATPKNNALLRSIMKKTGGRSEEGAAVVRMIISKARALREQQQLLERTQAAIAAARGTDAYKKLLADGSYNEAVKVLTSAGATGDEAREAAKADLKGVFMTMSDEDLEILVMMIPQDVLPAEEIARLQVERADALKVAAAKEAKAAKKAVVKEPVKKPEGKKTKKAAAQKPADPAPIAEEKRATIEPPPTMPEEIHAAKAEPAPDEQPVASWQVRGKAPHSPACDARATPENPPHPDCDEKASAGQGMITVRRWQGGASTDFPIEEKRWNRMQRRQAKAA